MTKYEIFALFLSIISLICSIYSAHKVNKFQKNNKYYDGLFKEFLFDRIPKLYREYVNDNQKPNMIVEEDFEKEIQEFRNHIIAMAFIDNSFYKTIDEQLVSIDDTVVRISNHTNEYTKLKDKLYNQISRLYEEINNFFN